jgi:hypothetical protein
MAGVFESVHHSRLYIRSFEETPHVACYPQPLLMRLEGRVEGHKLASYGR